MKIPAFLTLMCVAVFLPLSARGDDPAQCVASFENGQVFRKNGQLHQARKAFTRCAERDCPSALQLPCGKFLEDVEKVIPSVVFNVSVDGEDILDARLEMDGALLAERVDVRGTEVEPGLHTFTIRVSGFPPIERKLVVREGEKLKPVHVAFARPKPEKPKEPEKSAATEVPQTETRPIPLGVWITGGVGIVGLVLGATFEVLGESSRKDLESTCSPRCSDSDIDSVRSKYTVGDVALGIGAAGVITAGVWYLVRPTRMEPATVAVIPGANGIQIRTSF